jgi:hypothetical protein
MKRLIVLALAAMAFLAPLATSVGIAHADYTEPTQPEEAP